MPVQLVRLRELRKTDNPDDTLAPASIAGIEAAAVDHEDFVTGVLSQLKQIIHGSQAGDWHGAPVSVHGGDASLYALFNRATLEGKLVDAWRSNLNDATPPAAAYASETLTLTGQPLDTETVTIGTKTYTFQATLTDVDGNVLIGATASDSLDNLIAAITLGAGAGSTYAASTTLHPTATAAAGAGDTMDATAKKAGTAGNSIATTETLTNGSWGAATMSGGAGDVVALTGAYKPDKAIAIATTNKGAVTAQLAGAIGSADLTEIAGANALRPENLVAVFDGDTGDPIVDAEDRRIYGLLQVGSAATDGNAFGDSGDDQGQITFVVPNDTYSDLQIADGANIGGVNLVYDYTWREAAADLPAVYWRADIAGSDPQPGVTVSLDSAYNGGVFMEVDGSNVDIRLAEDKSWVFRAGAGGNAIMTVARDDSGNLTKVQIHSEADQFDCDAQDVDFDQGATFDSGGTPINVGETAGQIDATALKVSATTGNLEVAAGSGELQFTSSRDSQLELDDATAGAISALFGQSFASVSAAIKYAGEHGGMDLEIAVTVLASSYAAGVNVPGAVLDITTYPLDMNTTGAKTAFQLVFINGRLQYGGNGTTKNDVYAGTTPASGDLMHDKAKPLLSGDIIISLGLKQ